MRQVNIWPPGHTSHLTFVPEEHRAGGRGGRRKRNGEKKEKKKKRVQRITHKQTHRLILRMDMSAKVVDVRKKSDTTHSSGREKSRHIHIETTAKSIESLIYTRTCDESNGEDERANRCPRQLVLSISLNLSHRTCSITHDLIISYRCNSHPPVSSLDRQASH